MNKQETAERLAAELQANDPARLMRLLASQDTFDLDRVAILKAALAAGAEAAAGELVACRALLVEALEELADCIPYSQPYFDEKWGYSETLGCWTPTAPPSRRRPG